ncbi:sodium:alanine symporter family protein [Oscillatoria laete-virens NRMC-F 0139]|nr:sodium:alanine symporter family protein [Oscillatoria laete-virens]MDL5055764.1 sodium:alanine symporter family protein [Oscillatoria laete-virens NRMC-F 0139]
MNGSLPRMETLNLWIEKAAGFVWGPWLVILLFGTHLYMTLRTGFIQRHLWTAIKLSVSKEPGAKGDVSQFGSLMTALAATIGTGNIFGVAGAVLIGGPGAVFWMWLTGVFGIATKYAEALLSVKYRVTNEHGQMCGGPMYVLQNALNARWAGIIFAIFTAIAAFGIGNMAQSNTITDMIVSRKAMLPFEIGDTALKLSIAVILTTLAGAVILGGIKSIARFCAFLVPFMGVFYIIGCVVILISEWRVIGETVSLIVTSAFTGHAAVGGFIGAGIAEAMRYGIARGLFSNESGLGSAPIVAAAARTKDPVRQALVSSTGTFWDTVVVCALTGLVIVGSGDWSQEGMTRATLCNAAFGHLGAFGDIILVGGLLTFVFSTILGWSYYGEKAVEYLIGLKAIFPYRIIWVVAIFVGCVWKSDAVWNFSDMMNGLMAIPNLIAIFLLGKIISSETQRYFSGEKPEKPS